MNANMERSFVSAVHHSQEAWSHASVAALTRRSVESHSAGPVQHEFACIGEVRVRVYPTRRFLRTCLLRPHKSIAGSVSSSPRALRIETYYSSASVYSPPACSSSSPYSQCQSFPKSESPQGGTAAGVGVGLAAAKVPAAAAVPES